VSGAADVEQNEVENFPLRSYLAQAKPETTKDLWHFITYVLQMPGLAGVPRDLATLEPIPSPARGRDPIFKRLP
jgi:hypothetical protein